MNGIYNFIVSAVPARCESDKDCLKGQARCNDQKCHCNNKYATGDGKSKCESKYISLLTNTLPPYKGLKRLF